MSAKEHLRVEDAVSAGGVVWRRTGNGQVEVVLCGRRTDRSWMLPKGTPDNGETIEQTALREVREETGLEVALGEPLQTIEYWFTMRGIRYHKRVHHWLMQPVGGDLADHDQEFDEAAWVPIHDAIKAIHYENQRDVVIEAARRLGEAV